MQVIRFSITLLTSILINYTLEIYPANARTLGFSFCWGVSSVGSACLPWIVKVFIYVDLSGFIRFCVASILTLYFTFGMQ